MRLHISGCECVEVWFVRPGVMSAEMERSLKRSTFLRYIAVVCHIFASTESNEAWRMN